MCIGLYPRTFPGHQFFHPLSNTTVSELALSFRITVYTLFHAPFHFTIHHVISHRNLVWKHLASVLDQHTVYNNIIQYSVSFSNIMVSAEKQMICSVQRNSPAYGAVIPYVHNNLHRFAYVHLGKFISDPISQHRGKLMLVIKLTRECILFGQLPPTFSNIYN